MGNIVNNRINPSLGRKRQNQLKKNPYLEVSRRNFRFISKISTTGFDQESVIWLAENWEDSSEQFFVKKTNKYLTFRHSRVQSVINQLKILTKQNANSFMIQPLFAFQDYTSLYLVNQFVDGFTLEQVLRQHIFSEQQAKYIVIGLINVIQSLHQQKFAITQLSPKNILIDRKTGQMKLHQLVNPLSIDSCYPSNIVIPLNEYAAPQILLMDQVLAQSDYYSLGLILYYIMKNKPAIPKQKLNNRMEIINANIEVVKSDLPEGWRPEAADFLVKLLIKNPELRLGRYGSFQVKNHPWLQNHINYQNTSSSVVNLFQDFFKQKQYKRIKQSESSRYRQKEKEKHRYKQQINQSYQFQIQFESYSYRISQYEDDTTYDSINQEF